MAHFSPRRLCGFSRSFEFGFACSENLGGLEKVNILKKLHNLKNLDKLKKLSAGAGYSLIAFS